MDDLYPGWTGLADGVAAMAEGVLARLGRGEAGRYRRYDWVQERLAEHVDVEPVDLLVVEGVGSGALAYAELITTLVWLEAGRDVRLARGLARDGEEARRHWLDWMREEERWLVRERTRERADLVISTDELPAPRRQRAAQSPP
jgi:uridine kinase